SLRQFRAFARRVSRKRSDWSALARALWQMNEWDKARMLSELVDYFIEWQENHSPAQTELEALQHWSRRISREEFLGQVKGLGPRAFEQLHWYIDGKNAIKLDRHVVRFVNDLIDRPISDGEILSALTDIAAKLGISATALDARIWDYMQRRLSSSRGDDASCRGMHQA
ncbi:MAG TPA: hypothetical protein VML55_11085, partial [Planctomycetaceae bacterium]|nr:hypothetical protein [Planctomycetaceae bacterium]